LVSGEENLDRDDEEIEQEHVANSILIHKDVKIDFEVKSKVLPVQNSA
jgi:hypothetical protein